MDSRPLNTRFIVNPRSGYALRALPALQEFATLHGATIRATEHRRHAIDLARHALDDGIELVVAVGGDGTMNEVATALVGTHATLGLVPCGSGNGLARHLGLHGSHRRALDILLTGRPQLIDSGLADGHPFFTTAGVGFEAEIAARFNRLTRRGFARYLSTSASAFYRWRPQDFIISHDGASESVRAFTLAVSNANQYGNNARIAPDARIDDGLLDLCAVPPVRWRNALPLAVRLFGGTIGRVPGITMRRSACFTIERPQGGLLHTDGEVYEAGTRLAFVVRPASLRVLVPAPSQA